MRSFELLMISIGLAVSGEQLLLRLDGSYTLLQVNRQVI